MPLIEIHMLKGRTPEQKKKLLASVTQAVAESIDAQLPSIRVWIHEMPKENWGIAGVSAKDLGR